MSQESIGDQAGSVIRDAEKSLNRLSLTLVLACFYIGLTALATDYRMLLLEDPMVLQPFKASVPIKSFYIAAPFLIVILHLNLMIQQHALLCRRRLYWVGGFEDPNKLILQQLMPLQEYIVDDSWLRAHLWIRFIVTRTILPVLVLCIVQTEFLPYHSVGITFWHQFLVIADLSIVWQFLGVHGKAEVGRVGQLRIPRASAAALTSISLVYSVILAVLPGTWFEAWIGKHSLAGLVPRNLVFHADAAGAALAGRDLRGADFEGAVFVGADLRGADLTGAILENTDLRNADLGPLGVRHQILKQERGIQKTMQLEELIRKGEFRPTRLNGANLRAAKLQGASFIMANLSGADLRNSFLRGVELTGAKLRRAFLQHADLAGAEFSLVRMEGADLTGAGAEGTTFDQASLAGVSLNQADASAASFVSANLEGARLTEALLRAANFDGAALVGTDFRRASLQGSSSLQLEATDLRGAHLGGICKTSVLGLTDFRAVDLDFLPSQVWQELLQEVREKLQGRAEGEIEVLLNRIDEAASREDSTLALINCLGTLLSSPEAQRSLGFLRLDVNRNVIVEVERAAGSWNEAAFHKELAESLVEKACSSEGLALTVTLRAAGQYVPGDHDLDLELAKQLLVRLRDPNCRELQDFPAYLKRQIAWRLRNHVRAEEERR